VCGIRIKENAVEVLKYRQGGTHSSKETGFGSKMVPFECPFAFPLELPAASLSSGWRAILARFRGQNKRGQFGVQDWRGTRWESLALA